MKILVPIDGSQNALRALRHVLDNRAWYSEPLEVHLLNVQLPVASGGVKMFNEDPQTEAVVMVGEIGGSDEEECACWVKDNMRKPVVGFIAGVTAPPGKRMGHAGAIISGGKGTAAEKLAVMEECGIVVTRNLAEIGKLVRSVLK